MHISKKTMMRAMCLLIAGVMTFSVVAGLVMQVVYMMAV